MKTWSCGSTDPGCQRCPRSSWLGRSTGWRAWSRTGTRGEPVVNDNHELYLPEIYNLIFRLIPFRKQSTWNVCYMLWYFLQLFGLDVGMSRYPLSSWSCLVLYHIGHESPFRFCLVHSYLVHSGPGLAHSHLVSSRLVKTVLVLVLSRLVSFDLPRSKNCFVPFLSWLKISQKKNENFTKVYLYITTHLQTGWLIKCK